MIVSNVNAKHPGKFPEISHLILPFEDFLISQNVISTAGRDKAEVIYVYKE
jgi:hypothetical protein